MHQNPSPQVLRELKHDFNNIPQQFHTAAEFIRGNTNKHERLLLCKLSTQLRVCWCATLFVWLGGHPTQGFHTASPPPGRWTSALWITASILSRLSLPANGKLPRCIQRQPAGCITGGDVSRWIWHLSWGCVCVSVLSVMEPQQKTNNVFSSRLQQKAVNKRAKVAAAWTYNKSLWMNWSSRMMEVWRWAGSGFI